MEREIGQLTDNLHGLLFGLGLQRSLDSEEFHEEEKKLVKSLPKRLKGDGKEMVMVRTCRGESVPLQVRYYRRKVFWRRKGRRMLGFYCEQSYFFAGGSVYDYMHNYNNILLGTTC